MLRIAFFLCLGISFFHYSNFSVVKKTQFYFENKSLGTCRSFCDHWGNTKMRNQHWISMMLQPTFLLSPKLQISNLSFRYQSETFHLYKSTQLKNQWSCATHHNPESLKNLKTWMIFVSSPYSNSNFSEILGLIPSITVSIKNFYFCRRRFEWNTRNFDLRIRTLMVQKFQNNCYWFWVNCVFKHIVLGNDMFEFYHRFLNGNLHPKKGPVNESTLSQKPDSPKTSKLL